MDIAEDPTVQDPGTAPAAPKTVPDPDSRRLLQRYLQRLGLDTTTARARDRAASGGRSALGLLDDQRGGYCHEHAALVRQVLAALQVPSEPVLARILLRPNPELGPLTHQATLAEVDGRPVLVDPGFGAGTPTVALPLDDPTPRSTVHGWFRLVPAKELREVFGLRVDDALVAAAWQVASRD
ncbi:arylamine N-acetyltransferase [Luteococcus sp.]|uniref:arylamine N-acetyltransferase n=1 Tax=Luteococcus sp. TaxID=1969402 RepID=UPI0037350ECD